MFGSLLSGLRDDRQVQVPADYSSDVSNRYSFVGDAVIRGSSGGVPLKHKPVKMGSIEPVHRRPSIKPVTDVCRNALFTRNLDESRNEAAAAFSSDDCNGVKPPSGKNGTYAMP